MSDLRVTLVIEPPNNPEWPPQDRMKRFLRELGERLGTGLTTVEDYLHVAAPLEGFVLLCAKNWPETSLDQCAEDQRTSIAKRLVVLDQDPTRIAEKILEPLSLVGAIDSIAMSTWEDPPPNAIGVDGVRGRPEVGELIGATCFALYRSEHYGYLQSKTHTSLAHLLVDYLHAYQARYPLGYAGSAG